MDPQSLRARIDADASIAAADTILTDEELIETLLTLLAVSDVPRRLALRYLSQGNMRRRHDVDVDDVEAAFAWLLVRRIREGPDRHRLAAGASLCGWLTQYGWGSRALVVRQVVPPLRETVSLEDLTLAEEAPAVADEPAARPEEIATARDVPDTLLDSVAEAVRHRRGARRLLAAAGQVADIYDLPVLLAPTDPVDADQLRQDLADDPRLARRSLEAMRSLLDGTPWRHVFERVPDSALALWDDTTAPQRDYMVTLPDAVLGLHAQASVTLRPRPGERVRRRVARAVRTLVPAARPSLVMDVCDAFWDLTTDPVPENQAGITDAAAAAMRRAAAKRARAFGPRAARLARAGRGDLGSDAEDVRRFLVQVWAASDHNRT